MSPHEHESRQEQKNCSQSWCSCFQIQWKKPCWKTLDFSRMMGRAEEDGGGRGGTLWPFPVERHGGSVPWGCLHTEQGLEWGVLKHMVTGTSPMLIFTRENKFIC